MMIVDSALQARVEAGNPIRVAVVGAGYSGRTIVYQMMTAVPGIDVVAIANRTVENARLAFDGARAENVVEVNSVGALEDAIRAGTPAITGDHELVCEAEGIDAVVEATGTIEFGARVVVDAIEGGKHVVLLNAELDATLGPVLKSFALRAGIVCTNTDGDEPGVAMNMIRFVRSIGLQPVVAGNLKGLYDPYRTPETQKGFAEQHNQKATAMTSFADGTKLSMELATLANGAGFRVGRRGMYGPELSHVRESADYFRDKLVHGGMVDFLVGAQPCNGAFVLGYTEDRVRADYLKYLKMGEGPLYVFYTPFHLPQLEIPNTIARAVLLNDAAVTPIGAPFCDALAVAKKALAVGDTLDGIGGFTCYTLIDNYDASRQANALPMGVSEGCRVKRAVPKDRVLTYDDVELPPGRLCDELRIRQDELVTATA